MQAMSSDMALQPTYRSSGINRDQPGTLTGLHSRQHFPTALRRISFKNSRRKKQAFLTNHPHLSAKRICFLKFIMFSSKLLH